MEKLEQWVPLRQVAAEIGVSPQTLYFWCRSGRLGDDAKLTPGRHWVIRESWVQDMGRIKRGTES